MATLLLAAACAACKPASSDWHRPNSPAAETATEVRDADTGFTLIRADHAKQQTVEPPRLAYELAVLHILVPQDQEAAMEKIWNFLREDALEADTDFRLRQNGLRVGVGHAQWWEPIKAAMEAIEGYKVTPATSLRVPVGLPLSLELDSEPREQTLFYVGPDGILSGGTWPDSRNVLRVTYGPDVQDADRILLLVVPEVHQKQDGWQWLRTEAGLWQVPRQAMQAFDAAGFLLTLGPGEFALLAPSENAQVYGLLGGAFLTRESQGRHYSSYVFLRPEARHVGEHD
ncbi:MAG: hypothetical protein KKI02_09700 [Planctomycetes bacterium]|nr:hypothetical protein [Planctomycetota bacterium]